MSDESRAFIDEATPELAERLLTALIDHQSACWTRGDPIGLEQLVGLLSGSDCESEVALALIHHEVILRKNSGQTPTAQDYISRFPGLSSQIEELFEVEGYLDRDSASMRGRLSERSKAANENRDGAESKPLVKVPGYAIEGVLGQGGMGVVYRARHLELKRPVALKTIAAGVGEDSDVLARFRAEADAVARLQHPNIVQIYDVGESGGLPYLALELVEGQSLAAWSAGTPQPPRAVARIVETVARALDYAHRRGVIHRDLKPANVLLTTEGEPKVTDFGLAKQLAGDQSKTATGNVLGTPSYMAPEQTAGGVRLVDPRTDVYGLGAILYELLTGRPPFKAATPLETLRQVTTDQVVPPRRLVPNVPRDLETICLKCLEKEPEARYSTALDLSDDLRRFLAGRPVEARPVGRAAHAWRWCRRNPWLAGMAGAIVFLLASGAVGATLAAWFLDAARREATERGAVAERHERAAVDQLRQSLVEQAATQRQSNKAGRRERALELLRRAAALAPDLKTRSEAIACLVLSDLEPGRQWEGAPPGTLAVAFDSSHTRYARSSAHGGVEIRSVADDNCTLRLAGPARPAESLSFSPDGQFLAALSPGEGSPLQDLSVWDLHSRKLWIRAPASAVNSAIDFRPDSRRLAVATGDGSVVLFDLQVGREACRLAGPGARARSIAYGPTGRWIAIARADKPLVETWDTETGKLFFALAPPEEARALAWRGDGRYVVTACANGSIIVWDAIRYPQQIRSFQDPQSVPTQLAYSHSGDLLASVHADGRLRLWQMAWGEEVCCTGSGVVPPSARIQFSADDRSLAFAQSGIRIGLWEVAQGRDYLYQILCYSHVIDYSPDGRLFASAGPAGVFLWDTRTRKQLDCLSREVCIDVRFTADGSYLLATSEAGLSIWPVSCSTENGVSTSRIGRRQLRSFGGRITGLGVSRPGGTIAVVKQSAGIVLLRPDHWNEPQFLPGYPGISLAALSPDARWLAAGASGVPTGFTRVWDLSRGTPAVDLPAHPSRPEFSPDGKWLVTATGTDHRFWEVGSWRAGPVISTTPPAPDFCGVFGFSPNGGLFALAEPSRAPRLFDTSAKDEIATLTPPTPDTAQFLRFSPDLHQLTAVTGNRKLQVWDLSRLRRELAAFGLGWECASPASPEPQSTERPPIVELEQPAGQVRGFAFDYMGTSIDSVAFSPDGRQILSGEGHVLRLWDVATGREVRRFEAPSHGPKAAAFSPDGSRIFSCGWDRTLRLWDSATARELPRLNGHSNFVHSAVFTPDGRGLLSVSGDGTSRLWDVSTGENIRTFRQQGAWLGGVAVSPDGRWAVVTGSLHAPVMWDLETGALVCSFEEQPPEFHAVTFARGGKVVIAQGADGGVYSWDAASGRVLPQLCDLRHEVCTLASSPDGSRILTGSTTGVVSLWDVESRRLLRQFDGHTSQIHSVAFSPDGRYGVSGGGDGTIRVWQLPPP
jgi:WD40 repeat protein